MEILKSLLICLTLLMSVSCSSLRTYDIPYDQATAKLEIASHRINRYSMALIEAPSSKAALFKPHLLGCDELSKVTATHMEYEPGREFSLILRGFKDNELDIIETTINIFRSGSQKILVDIKSVDIDFYETIRPDIQMDIHSGLKDYLKVDSSISFEDKKSK